jgi:hypothetical protein
LDGAARSRAGYSSGVYRWRIAAVAMYPSVRPAWRTPPHPNTRLRRPSTGIPCRRSTCSRS